MSPHARQTRARLELFRWLEQGKLKSRTNLDRSTKVHGFYWNPVASSHWSIELWAYITVGHRKHAEVEVVSSSRGERWSGRGQGNGWRPGGIRPKISEPQNQSSAVLPRALWLGTRGEQTPTSSRSVPCPLFIRGLLSPLSQNG